MGTISLILLFGAVLLLIFFFFNRTTDHYANQVVHAGVGNIAGPLVELDSSDVGDAYETLQGAEEDMNSVIVGKV